MAAAPKNVYHGNVQVTGARVHTDSEKSLDEVLTIADRIWRRAQAEPADANPDELYKQYRKEFLEFSKSYPTVFQWMVRGRQYDREVFTQFLKTCVKPLYRDRKEFLAAQAEYLVIFYRKNHPKSTAKQIDMYRKAVLKSYEEEDNKFMAAKEKADEEVAQLKKAADLERRERLRQFLYQRRREDPPDLKSDPSGTFGNS